MKKSVIFLFLLLLNLNLFAAKKSKISTKINYEIKYSKSIDLVYHVFSHIQIDNPSNLFNETYVNDFAKLRGKNLNISNDMVNYYLKNFERLSFVQFLIFYVDNLDDYYNAMLNYNNFSPDDKKYFVTPYISLLNEEKDFYFDYWEKLYAETESSRTELKQYFEKRFEPYENFFLKKGRNATICLSFSLSVNGRGINIDKGVAAVAPFPKSEKEKNHAFFQLFHEFTHQLTDNLIQDQIRMDDGSHMLSEYMVILEDYYLVKQAGVDDVKIYFAGIDLPDDITEELFCKEITVPLEIDSKLKELVN